ncbi:hypothetical protein FSP39_024409 [Pinctada imbricata]|uniref:Proteasome assembly chaperone 2 n=1 Tax=Pinctada imbricata TaxID=66713 RepID=A0AA89BY09_PINIB|nr:hypothetical protein FSP39_024409 [Pinctada imbricata]
MEELSPKNLQNRLETPAVSVGNVGQLATDLLISTLWMERIGYIHHESILPLVGNDPFAHPEADACKVVTSCEVYELKSEDLVVIQQRAPFVRGKATSFRKWLMSWIKEKGFSKVVILTSSHAHERLDRQLGGSQFRYMASKEIEDKFGERFHSEELRWQQLEQRISFPAPSNPQIDVDNSTNGMVYLPGGGIAKSLYEDCLKESIPAIVMLMFCSEGDNAPDALSLAYHVNDWLGLYDFKPKYDVDGKLLKPATSWKIPVSWRLLFGSNFDQTLFH